MGSQFTHPEVLMAARKPRAKKRAPAPKKLYDTSIDIADLKDQINGIIDVVQTVVDALNQESSIPAAMVLMRYGLEPLYALKEELSGDNELDDEEAEP